MDAGWRRGPASRDSRVVDKEDYSGMEMLRPAVREEVDSQQVG